MKVERVRAADSQTALREIRRSFGPDVMILSSTTVGDGVEFVISSDLSAQNLPSEDSSAQDNPAATTHGSQRRDGLAPVQPLHPDTQTSPDFGDSEPNQQAISALQRGIQDTRRLLDERLQASEPGTHQEPQHSQRQSAATSPVARLLADLEIDSAWSQRLLQSLPTQEPVAVQREILHLLMARALPVSDEPMADVTALIGVNGAGKTTCLAKLAAQALIHEPQRPWALVTLDNSRIGAREQFKVYGRIFQHEIHVAADVDQAVTLIESLRSRQRVLVDTAGLSARKPSDWDTIQSLCDRVEGLQCALTLPADQSAWAMRYTLERAMDLPLQGLILSRCDLAPSLGPALSMLASQSLPLMWYSDGAAAPRFWHRADAMALVKKAFSDAPAGLDSFSAMSA